MKINLDGIVTFTKAKQSQTGWYLGKCVAHSDHNASLSFKVEENGQLRLKCFAGCSRESIIENLLNAGLVEKSYSRKRKPICYYESNFDNECSEIQIEIAVKATGQLKKFKKQKSQGYIYRKVPIETDVLVNADKEIFPCLDVNDRVWGYQTIAADGDKRFLKGQKTSGTFYPVGDYKKSSAIILCEGVATGYSVHYATKLPVLCTFSVSNLRKVLQQIKDKYPDKQIIIAGDNDHGNK